MNVVFTCEKCGLVLGSIEGLTPGTATTREKIARENNRLESEGCPNCRRVTYGPLTEGMVSRALVQAWHRGEKLVPVLDEHGEPGYVAEARFVIRLLEEVHGRHEGWTLTDVDWPAVLSELASRP